MRVLAVDCGGTRSTGLLMHGDGERMGSQDMGPANLYVSGPAAVARVVDDFLHQFPAAEALALSVAGVRTDGDREVLLAAIRARGIDLPLAIYSDARAALRSGGVRSGVAVIAGTGSAALAVGEDGTERRVGGWGSVLGDEGSGYWIGRELLCALVRAADEEVDVDPALREATLLHYGLASVDDLRSVAYSPDGRSRVASLASLVAERCAESGGFACELLDRTSAELARLALLARDAMSFDRTPALVLAGGVLTGSPHLRWRVWERTHGAFAAMAVAHQPAVGAYLLAMEEDRWDRCVPGSAVAHTERANARSATMDRLDTVDLLRLMNEEDAGVALAVARCLESIAAIVDRTVQRLSAGGRLVYVGAGTSGRLAMLDAVECVPTFGTDPGQVMALIAGGVAALTHAVEGAEDDVSAAQNAIAEIQVGAADVVVGVSASGSAAYVRAALSTSHSRGAFTALITANPQAEAIRQVDVAVAVDVGPEVIAGSTRLKAGTAQKLVLNMISTATMVRLGRTVGNRMVSVRPTNRKLRQRAIRLVRELSGGDEAAARQALERSAWDVARATLLLRLGCEEAVREQLGRAGGDPRRALQMLEERPEG
jgi:N-acetylmuramic acid 6-phosphate etherase